MKNVPIKGIIPPIVTPMSADESVNIPELRNQIERQIAGGVHGIFPFGTNGEGYILSMKEKEEVLEATIDQVKGRIPVYAGTGCISTRDTIYMSKRAEEMGADVLSIITPSFALASQKELYDHYCEVAKHVSIPIVLYNIPARTGNKLLPETVGKLARDVDVIMGAKDSSGDIENNKGIFAGGDCVTGPATAIRAIAAGKVAAANIDEHLGFRHEIEVDIDIPAPRLNNRAPHGRINTTEREACDRKCDFEDIECGLTEEGALAEASRCLRCDDFGYGIFRGGRNNKW